MIFSGNFSNEKFLKVKLSRTKYFKKFEERSNQLAFTCSQSKIKTLEKGVKHK